MLSKIIIGMFYKVVNYYKS